MGTSHSSIIPSQKGKSESDSSIFSVLVVAPYESSLTIVQTILKQPHTRCFLAIYNKAEEKPSSRPSLHRENESDNIDRFKMFNINLGDHASIQNLILQLPTLNCIISSFPNYSLSSQIHTVDNLKFSSDINTDSDKKNAKQIPININLWANWFGIFLLYRLSIPLLFHGAQMSKNPSCILHSVSRNAEKTGWNWSDPWSSQNSSWIQSFQQGEFYSMAGLFYMKHMLHKEEIPISISLFHQYQSQTTHTSLRFLCWTPPAITQMTPWLTISDYPTAFTPPKPTLSIPDQQKLYESTCSTLGLLFKNIYKPERT